MKYLKAAVLLFVFLFLYEWVMHGVVLSGLYETTAHVYRSDMDQLWPLALVYQGVLALWATFAFSRIYPEGGWRRGLRFGLYFGVFAGILTASWYLWLEVPALLGLSWFLVALGEGLGGGLVLGTMYSKSRK